MAKTQKIGYIRVSSVDQNPERQRQTLAGLEIDKIFEDHASGSTTSRPEFQKMLDYCRDGDCLYVTSMDRFARSLGDLLSTTTKLREKGVEIVFLKENITLLPNAENDASTNFLLGVLGAVAEFERALLKERQREGIAIAKAKGLYKGRKPVDPTLVKRAIELVKAGVPRSKAAKDVGIGATTLWRYLKHNPL